MMFSDVADGLVGVGLITNSEDMPGTLALDKGHNDMSKFLNRILGMHVEKQNMLFKYFADTLNAIISQAKRTGKYDQVQYTVYNTPIALALDYVRLFHFRTPGDVITITKTFKINIFTGVLQFSVAFSHLVLR